MSDTRRSVAEARSIVLEAVRRGAPRQVALEAAAGLVLAEAPVAPVDVPAHPNAGMDGYAVRAADVVAAGPGLPVRLPVAGVSPAGGGTPPALAPGTAMRIYTGGVVPAGADSVIRQEDTDRGAAMVTITATRDLGRNVRPAGGDVRAGEAPVPAGTVLTPARLGVLASLGVETVAVFPPPRVGILSTGDELAGPGEAALVRQGERLGDSNAVALVAAVRAAGGQPIRLGPVRDDPAALRSALVPHLPELDLLLTTGGVSVGDRDLVRGVLAELGAVEAFHRVRLRPGGPTVFGMLPGDLPWLGLPGNPVSTLVTFTLFALPALRRMLGRTPAVPPVVRVALAEPVAPDAVLELHLRATLAHREGEPAVAHLTGLQGSQVLTSMARADVLLRIPPGTAELAAGTLVEAVPVHGTE